MDWSRVPSSLSLSSSPPSSNPVSSSSTPNSPTPSCSSLTLSACCLIGAWSSFALTSRAWRCCCGCSSHSKCWTASWSRWSRGGLSRASLSSSSSPPRGSRSYLERCSRSVRSFRKAFRWRIPSRGHSWCSFARRPGIIKCRLGEPGSTTFPSPFWSSAAPAWSWRSSSFSEYFYLIIRISRVLHFLDHALDVSLHLLQTVGVAFRLLLDALLQSVDFVHGFRNSLEGFDSLMVQVFDPLFLGCVVDLE